MPSTSNSQFYVVGGTVNPDSPTYVVRRADQELFYRLMAGDFCYVLTSRQMGKSSLMARTAKRMSEAGVHTAIVDLTQIGTEKEKESADQWYYGIAHRILRELQIRDVDLGEWWQSRENLPALQRLVEFFSDLVLEKIDSNIVIFIDEIDSTITLPFTDDFFAAIRACYNSRATEANYYRLSFVLLGVAGPSDLIKDATRTPFNIGHHIELTDFTFEEARLLAKGLNVDRQGGEQVLSRILDWTNGHPYLTQKLCNAMEYYDRERAANARPDVDSIVEQALLSQTASREDSNLNFVRDWMIGNKKLSGKVFKLYRRIHRGTIVADAPLSPDQNHLKLSGVVALRPDRTLRVRNRVYERVFTAEWAKKMIPVDWNRRLAVASTMLLLLSIGFWFAVLKPRQYITPLQTALENYPGRYHEALRRYPWYADKANELMAQFWERSALRDEGRGRDEALLERLQAIAARPTELRRQEASFLIGGDYPNLLFTLRHGTDVSAVAFSPDGKRVLTGGGGSARVWDAQTGEPIGRPLQHDDQVSAVAFSSDGRRVLTASHDRTVRIWDAQTGQSIGKPLHYSGAAVIAVAFSPDGKLVLTGSRDGTARMHDVQTSQQIGKSLRHAGYVDAVAFSPDGKRVLTGSRDRTARMWDMQTGRQIGEALRHGDSVSAVAFSSDGKRVLTGIQDEGARMWDTQTGRQIGEALRHGDTVWAVAFSPDGKQVLTGNNDCAAWMWNAQTGQKIGEPMLHGDSVRAVAFSPDGKRVLTGSSDGTARLWDAQANQQIGKSLRHASYVDAVLFSPDGKRALTMVGDHLVQMWDVRTGQQIGEPLQHPVAGLLAVAFSSDGKRVLTSSKGGMVWVWDAHTSRPTGMSLRYGAEVSAAAFSPDGKRVVIGGENGMAIIWDSQTRRQIGGLLRHEGLINDIAYSLDGKLMLTGSWDGTARIWETDTGKQIGNPLRHGSLVDAVAFSPDGKRVLTGGKDNMLRMWDAQTGKQIGNALRHSDQVKFVAFSSDGKQVLSESFQWSYLSTVTENGLTPKSSRFVSQRLTRSYRFLDGNAYALALAVMPGDSSSLKIETIGFDVPDTEPLQGNPHDLLRDWQKKLGLEFDASQNQKLVPIYPVEPKETSHVDPNEVRTVAGFVPVYDVRTERSNDGYLRILISGETPTRGWRLYTHHEITGNNTLEVRLRGFPPASFGYRQVSHPTAPTIIIQDRNKAISHVVVHGSNGARTMGVAQ